MADGIPISEWSGSGATRELHETIKLQIASTDRQSKAIKCLTVFMAVLAVIQTVATVVQVVPIVQGFQNQPATNNLANPSGQLNQQQAKPPLVTHEQTPKVVP